MKRQLTVVDNTSDDKKEMKLLKLNNNKKINFFTQLPKELVYYVLTFIAGNDYIKINPVNIGDVGDYKIENKDDTEEKELFKFDNNRTIEDLDKFIIPLENIKTLISLTCCTSKSLFFLKGNLSQTIIENNSDNEINEIKEEELNYKELSIFDRLWLNCYNFQEKLTYWIRTTEFDNLLLNHKSFCIPAEKIPYMYKLEKLIQFKERGVTVEEKDAQFIETLIDNKFNEYNNELEEEENTKDYVNKEKQNIRKQIKEDENTMFYSEEEGLKGLKERLNKLMITEQEVLENNNLHNLFDLFIFKALLLTLKIYRKFDCDTNDTDTYKTRIMSSKYLESYDVDGEFNDCDYKKKGINCKKYGLSIHGPYAWDSFLTFNGCYVFFDNDDSQDKEKNIYVLKKGLPLTEDQVKEKLNNYFYLHLQNVGFFNEEFKNLIFPNSIRILSFHFSSHLFYSIKPKDQWDNLFENVKFPNVKYLRIYFDHSAFNCGDDEFIEIEDAIKNKSYISDNNNFNELQSFILKHLLKKERFPSLNHLVLNGFSKDNLIEECDISLLQQLLTIEFRFELTEEAEKKCSEIYSPLIALNSKLLKFVIVQTYLDPRLTKAISYEELEKYYDLKDKTFVFSIGNISLTVFYERCSDFF
ncbi:hypothetical protein ABK040_016465 [Willaertia magna]